MVKTWSLIIVRFYFEFQISFIADVFAIKFFFHIIGDFSLIRANKISDFVLQSFKFFQCVFTFLSRNWHQIFISIFFSMDQFILSIIRYKEFTLLFFYVAKAFDRHVSDVTNRNFVWLFIYFGFIQINIFYIDHVMEKLLCRIFQ